MRFLILNGPNLNLLGSREPDIYGTNSYESLCKLIADTAAKKGDTVTFFQSNHEGAIIDIIQSAEGNFDGIVINPGAYSHYSYAIHDALRSISVPAVEVHISNIMEREPWRQISVTAPACRETIAGQGFAGYLKAMELLRNGDDLC